MARGHSTIITKASHDLLTAHAAGNMLACEQRETDGAYVAWFDDDVWEYLNALSDNVDEAIRLVCTPGGVGHA